MHLYEFGFTGWVGIISIVAISAGIESISATGFAIPRFCIILLLSYGVLPAYYFNQIDQHPYKLPTLLFCAYILLQIPKVIRHYNEYYEKILIQEKLSHEKEQLETLIDLIPAGISWINKDLTYIRTNKYVADSVGLNKENFKDKKYGFCLREDETQEGLEKFIQSDEQSLDQIISYKTWDNQEARHETLWQKIGKGEEIIILTVNFEKQLKLQEENIELMKKIDLITQASGVGFFFEDIEKNTLVVTKNLIAITNLPNLEDAKEADNVFNEKIDENYRENVTNKLKLFYDGKISSFSEYFKFKKSDNETIWLHLFLIAETRNAESYKPIKVIGYHQDITKQIEMEIKVSQTAKLESIGLMASGIAHEINNPLTIISMLNQKIDRRLSSTDLNILDKEDLKKYLHKIDLSIKRISKIIQSLKVYSRDSIDDSFESITLKNFIDDITLYSEPRLNQAEAKMTIESNVLDLKIKCQPVALSKAIINLINNSIDAVEKIENKWIKISITHNGNEVDSKIIMKITDAGLGIPKPIKEKILNPFFTTKEIGKGTGLGLSICESIIKNHQGMLYVDDEEPNTTFVIELPA
jgi:signal transduction histidine kinase/PAS domain-containing protein